MAKPAILLVDDEKPLLALLTKFMERSGYAVDVCETGRAALEKCRQTPCPFQVVVLDLRLPDMTGEEVLSALLQDVPGLCVLISSGTPWSPDALPPSSRARAGSLLKPYMPKQLLEAVQAMVAG